MRFLSFEAFREEGGADAEARERSEANFGPSIGEEYGAHHTIECLWICEEM